MSTRYSSPPIGDATCGVCGSKNLKFKFAANDRNFGTTSRTFKICGCTSCGIIQTIPRPSLEELEDYYPKTYYPVAQTAKDYYAKHIRRFQKHKVSLIQSIVPKGELLDIGCGAGFFLKEAAESGYKVNGIEFSEDAARFGRENYGLPITTANVYDLKLVRNSYDVITLWQVLEHLHNPMEILALLHASLRKSGVLVIAVPNISSFQARIFRHLWYHLEVPRHLFHYDPQTLGQLLRNAGFQIVGLNYNSPEHNGAGFLGSVIQFNQQDEGILHKVFRKSVGYYVGQSLGWTESKLGRGGTFTIISALS